jgi:aspartate aminotransferase
MISERAFSIKPSATLALNAKVKQMIKSGEDIINFTVGEPDFDTPDNIKNAAIDAIKEGFTKYTAPDGIPELKEAISEKFKKDNNLEYSKNEIIVSNGAKHSIYNVLQSLLNNGDEVIILSPYWVSYAAQVSMSGGFPVIAETNQFQLDIEKVKKSLSKKTKLVMVNSPNNPTGAVFSKDSLKCLAELSEENNFYILSDEIYENLVYDSRHFSPAQFAKDRTIIVNGVSKSYSMTGWRIGYAVGPEEIIKSMGNMQSQATGNPSSISQKAALEAIKGPQDFVLEMKEEFRKRRDFVLQRLSEIGLETVKPEGAFYVFPKTGGNSLEIAQKLLEKAKIATVPGVEFGAEGHIRMSYATSMENLEKGLDRMEKFFS